MDKLITAKKLVPALGFSGMQENWEERVRPGGR